MTQDHVRRTKKPPGGRKDVAFTDKTKVRGDDMSDMTHDISRYDDDDDDDDDDNDKHDEEIVGSRVLNISTIEIKKLRFQRGLVTSACKNYLWCTYCNNWKTLCS